MSKRSDEEDLELLDNSVATGEGNEHVGKRCVSPRLDASHWMAVMRERIAHPTRTWITCWFRDAFRTFKIGRFSRK